jgi:mitochondrial fission protein ELM1
MTVNDAVDASASGDKGLIWAVLSYRSGENTQILGLAREFQARSGWRLEVKRLDYRSAGIYNLTQRVGLRGVRMSTSSPLVPPWPDLVISAGLRNEPPCRWIRKQSAGRTRVVFLGRSWVGPDKLDLLVTTPQYRVPEHPRVLQNRLTLHGVNDEWLRSAASRWDSAFNPFPHPRAVVLLGGSVGPYVVGEVAVDRIAEYLKGSKFASALISSSSRTEPGLVTRLAKRIDMPAFVYEWKPDDAENPYAGLLALSDELIVSGDSIAMLSEAAATGKGVRIVDLGAGAWSMGSRAGRASRREDVDFNARFYRFLMRYGHRRWTRDISRVHEQLIANGQAAWLGEAVDESVRREQQDDMDAAIRAVRALWSAQDPAALADTAVSSTKRPSTTRYTRSETSASAD